MSETANLELPLLDADQAQKHVTVNEALARIDAILPASVRSRSGSVPAAPVDGEAYVVPAGATGEWAGRDHVVALFLNGGWDFLAPWTGLSLWVVDEAVRITYAGRWIAGAVAHGAGGAATIHRIAEIDHGLAPASISTVSAAIPDKACVIGVSARVTVAIAGPGSWQLGVPGSPDRYGSGYGTAKNSWAQGVTGSPVTYYGDTDLILTATSSSFSDGRVLLSIHYLALMEPAAVP